MQHFAAQVPAISSHRSSTPSMNSHRDRHAVSITQMQGKENDLLIALTGRFPREKSPFSGKKVNPLIGRKSSLVNSMSNTMKENAALVNAFTRKKSLHQIISKPTGAGASLTTTPQYPSALTTGTTTPMAMNSARTSAVQFDRYSQASTNQNQQTTTTTTTTTTKSPSRTTIPGVLTDTHQQFQQATVFSNTLNNCSNSNQINDSNNRAALNSSNINASANNLSRPLFHKSSSNAAAAAAQINNICGIASGKNEIPRGNLISLLMSDRSMVGLSSELQRRISSCSRERQEQSLQSSMNSTSSLLKSIQSNMQTQQPSDIFRSSLRTSTGVSSSSTLKLFSDLDHPAPTIVPMKSQQRNNSLSSLIGNIPQKSSGSKNDAIFTERTPLYAIQQQQQQQQLLFTDRNNLERNSIATIFQKSQEKVTSRQLFQQQPSSMASLSSPTASALQPQPACVAIDIAEMISKAATVSTTTTAQTNNQRVGVLKYSGGQPQYQQHQNQQKYLQYNNNQEQQRNNVSPDAITRISTLKDSPSQSVVHDFQIDGNYLTMV